MGGLLYGWAGKTLRVDLSSGRVKIESTEQYVNDCLGGKGMGQQVIFDEVPVDAAPFDEGNVIVFSAGTLVGTSVPASCRLSIDSKNAVTGGVATSNAGGHFAPELKFAGFDAIIVRGISQEPVYLEITDNSARINSARHLWGQGTRETERLIREAMRDRNVKALSIGPAGENRVMSACIIVDGARAAGRGALGAVMGSKKLKAIAVRGTQGLQVRHPRSFYEESARIWRMISMHPSVRPLQAYGTPSTVVNANKSCRLPVRNFQDDHWDDSKINRVSPEVFKGRFGVRKLACFNCPVHCSAFYRIMEGEFAGVACEGFQANLNWGFMSKVDMDNPAAALKIQELCIDLGLDLDNSSGVISWAMELYEKGIIDNRDTGGLDLQWGSYKVIIELINQIAFRKGFGDLLALGVKEASRVLGRGSERYAVHVKGQELAEAIRSCKGWGFGTVVAPRGGGHLDGAIMTEIRGITREESLEWFGVATAGDPAAYKDKAAPVFWYECFKGAVDITGVCYFVTAWRSRDLIGPEELARLYTMATGREIGAGELMTAGRRVHNLMKGFNTLHAGFGRADDYPPPRLMDEPIKSGLYRGESLDRQKWGQLLDEYYEFHGWDRETGWQTLDTLKKLGMTGVAERLHDHARLVEK